MEVNITAFVKSGYAEHYIPIEKDLQLVFHYSPPSYWKDLKVQFVVSK